MLVGVVFQNLRNESGRGFWLLLGFSLRRSNSLIYLKSWCLRWFIRGRGQGVVTRQFDVHDLVVSKHERLRRFYL